MRRAARRFVRNMTPQDLLYFSALSFVIGAVLGVHLALA